MPLTLQGYNDLLAHINGRRDRDFNGEILDINRLYQDFDQVVQGQDRHDWFFEHYGAGNTIQAFDRPYERMLLYVSLLEMIKDYSPDGFIRIHKGTPYYFIGWLAFQVEDFETGLFYIDAAISEDVRRIGLNYNPANDPSPTPAIRFLTLEQGHIAEQAETELEDAVLETLREFSQSASVNMDKNLFISRFVLSNMFIDNPAFRTIITSLYTFILEYESRKLQLRLRSSVGGSIEPFLLHLFKGGVIFESLVKMKGAGIGTSTLGRSLDAHSRNNNALGVMFNRNDFPNGISLDEAINLVSDPQISQDSFPMRAYKITYALRNTTGHTLAWLDQFDENTYEILFRYVMGAILWTIYKLWIEMPVQ